MDILKTVLSYDSYVRSGADFSSSQISGGSGYQLYLASIGTDKIVADRDLSLGVNARLGTGFHMFAEDALINSDIDVLTEYAMTTTICNSKYTLSGTADVIYHDGDEWIIGDFKTKGAYQMKKALKGDIKNERLQLSIYAYLYCKTEGEPMPKLGEIYLILTGDKAYINKADGGGTVPKYKTIIVELMGEKEVEDFLCDRIENISDVVDCQDWQCNYCDYTCKYRNNIPKPEDQF